MIKNFKIKKQMLKNLISKRAVYYAIPKNANTSLRQAFEDKIFVPSWQHNKRFANNPFVFKFAFVRNPYEKLISCYENRVNREEYRGKEVFNGIIGGVCFYDFIRQIIELDDSEADMHIKTQSFYLLKNGKIFVDYIGRVENINEDFNFILEKIGLERFELKKKNPSKRNGEYLTPELKNMIYERYEEDFINFGYEK